VGARCSPSFPTRRSSDLDRCALKPYWKEYPQRLLHGLNHVDVWGRDLNLGKRPEKLLPRFHLQRYTSRRRKKSAVRWQDESLRRLKTQRHREIVVLPRAALIQLHWGDVRRASVHRVSDCLADAN